MPINDHFQFAHQAIQKDLKEQAALVEQVFRAELFDCLFQCAAGRTGLFTNREDEDGQPWPEADRLRRMAASLQSLSSATGEPNELCEQFLDLCTIHGESDPGESVLARALLDQMIASR